MAQTLLHVKTPVDHSHVSDGVGPGTFETALRELRAPSRAVIAQAVRELFQAGRADAKAKRTQARQHEAELSEDFYAFLILHQDTPAFAKLKAEKGRLLRLANEKGADDE